MYNFRPDINITPGDEFFLALCKSGLHSFVTLGVVLADQPDSPILLARVGKCAMGSLFFNPRVIFQDELFCESETKREISYQAYTITAEQADQCVQLLSLIDQTQLKDKITRANFSNKEHPLITAFVSEDPDKEGIQCYQHVILSRHNFPSFSEENGQKRAATQVAHNAYRFNPLTNTCRHTALDIVEFILKFKTGISAFFLLSPRYKTHMFGGRLYGKTWYIVPASPLVYASQLSPKQLHVANCLYEQLSNIPTQKLSDPLTRKKFNAIKAIYMDIVGEAHLDVAALLGKICAYERDNQSILYASRSPCLLSQWMNKYTFFQSPVTTREVFNGIKRELNHPKSSNSRYAAVPG